MVVCFGGYQSRQPHQLVPNYAIKRDLRENTGFKSIVGRVGPLFWLLAGESIFSLGFTHFTPAFRSLLSQHQGLSSRCILPWLVLGLWVFLFRFPVFCPTALTQIASLSSIWRRACRNKQVVVRQRHQVRYAFGLCSG